MHCFILSFTELFTEMEAAALYKLRPPESGCCWEMVFLPTSQKLDIMGLPPEGLDIQTAWKVYIGLLVLKNIDPSEYPAIKTQYVEASNHEKGLMFVGQ